ncbi:transcription factor HES-3 [Sceloporus undulatus]|uniref:transcription factor HES-3 n=1 Tax=Sceloporus undulatus TaxID=8520 RepID=UPI001C4B668B|nr:transcription factor HES-3 [Sceloporus undulatus]
MGTDYRSQERRAVSSFRKVSKPLMEKKRRARINLSLEQLKALLEKHYSHQIRKRKLEKADILELSVKYMKSLQHPAPGPARSTDYQAGFQSCIQGVRQFLLRSSEATGLGVGDRWSCQFLHDLAQILLPSGGDGGSFSAIETNARPAALQEPRMGSSPKVHEVPLVPGCRKATSDPQTHPRGACQAEASPPAPGRGWSQARSGQGPPERNPGLWRPW